MHPPNPNPTAHGPKHAVLNTTEAHQLRWRQANFFFPDPKKMPHPTPAPMFHRTMSLGGSPMRVTPLQTTFGPVFEPRVYHLMAHCPRQTKRKINKKWLDFAHAAPICLPAFLSRFCRHCPHGGLTSNMCAPSIWVGGWVALCLCVCASMVVSIAFCVASSTAHSVLKNRSRTTYQMSCMNTGHAWSSWIVSQLFFLNFHSESNCIFAKVICFPLWAPAFAPKQSSNQLVVVLLFFLRILCVSPMLGRFV